MTSSHRPVTYASSRCPDPLPQKRPDSKKPDETKLPPKRRQTETVSFDRLCMMTLHRVLLQIFFYVNPHPKLSGWHWPSLKTLLIVLQAAISEHPTKKTKDGKWVTYGDAQRKFGLELVVAVIDDVDEATLRKVRARDLGKNTIFGRWRGLVYSIRPLFALTPFPDVLVPGARMKVVRSKISTPRRNWVHGPYLAILLVEKSTGLAVRARFLPLWFDLALDRFGIARSKPECYLLEAVSESGGVAFTPTLPSQLGDLQRQFGHVWSGNLGLYPYLPDPVLMPEIGQKPSITEFMGMPRFRHYASDMKPKLLAGTKGEEEGHYNFEPLIGKPGSLSDIQKQIREWAVKLYADPRNGLFRAGPL